MVIMGLKYGRLANRLFAFSHFIANAIEYDYKLLNPTFDEYRKYFAATSTDDFASHDISVKFSKLYPIFSRIISVIKRYNFRNSSLHFYIESDNDRIEFDLNNMDYLVRIKEKKFVFACGWAFRDYKNFDKYSNILRNFFRPVSPYMENIEALLRKSKIKADVLVGVHIRKGDYKDWNGGIYYYDDDVYYDKMLQIESHLKCSGKKVSFLMCSDEKIDLSNFHSLAIIPGPGHLIEDLYSLSKCDYIIGPPSTYSMWASFYGQVPYLHIMDPSQRLDNTRFTINNG
jgi:hypothetical protein